MSNKVDESPPTKVKELAVNKDVLKQYVGVYQLAPTFSIKVTLEDDHLYAQASVQPKFQIYPELKTRFFLKL